jgi:hypothetical protein
MLRRVLNGIAVAGLATALLAGTAAIQTASADFASDLNAALASGNPNTFEGPVIGLGKTNPDKGAQIGKALGGVIDEDQAASVAGAIAGGVKNAQFSAALFQALAEYYPAVRADIAAAIIAADPTSEAAVAAALEEVNTAAGAGLLSNPGPGAAPVNVNNTVSDLQEAFIKTPGTTRLGQTAGGQRFGRLGGFTDGGPTTSPTNMIDRTITDTGLQTE